MNLVNIIFQDKKKPDKPFYFTEMSKYLGQVLIVFLVICSVSSLDIPFISDIQDLIGLAHDVGDIASGSVPLKSFFVETVNPINVIMDTVTQLVDQVTTLGTELNGKLDSVLNAVLVIVPLEGKIDNDIKEVINYMAKIDEKYDDFQIYTEFSQDYAQKTLRDHINSIIGKSAGDLQDLLHSMLIIIVPPKSAIQRATLLENIKHLRDVSDEEKLCDLDISFQHRIYKIYNILMITELKAFIMTQFAYKQLSELDDPQGGSVLYVGEMKRAQVKYIMRAAQYQLEVKKIMQGASREIFRCPPQKLIEDETHLEFERVFSGYAINEWQLGNCGGNCGDHGVVYSHKLSYKLYVPKRRSRTEEVSYSIENICRGQIRNCISIGKTDLCENPEGSKRRYQYLRSKSKGYYKDWTNCEGGKFKQITDFRWGLKYCSFCLCSCFQDKAESNAIRTVSLRPQMSNIEENKVVSNLRFILKDKMMHIQIEEASLLPAGLLSPINKSWVPLEDFEYFPNVTSEGGFMLKNGDEYSDLTKDSDYAFIKYDRRRFNLDEISAGAGYVVTGVRWNFENQYNKNISNFQLEIHVTPFNFSNGKLTLSDENPSIWLTPTTQPNPPVEYTEDRTEQDRGTRINFDRTGTFSTIITKNKYIELGQSNIWSEAGQTTIPFFDVRFPSTVQNLAFDGIGTVFYWSDNDHTGIVGLKVLTIDLTKYVKPQLKGSQLNYYKKLYREPLRHNILIMK